MPKSGLMSIIYFAYFLRLNFLYSFHAKRAPSIAPAPIFSKLVRRLVGVDADMVGTVNKSVHNSFIFLSSLWILSNTIFLRSTMSSSEFICELVFVFSIIVDYLLNNKLARNLTNGFSIHCLRNVMNNRSATRYTDATIRYAQTMPITGSNAHAIAKDM